MANRAFFRNLYNAQNQHFTSIVRRSGREAVASTDRTTKRKRADEEYGMYQPNFLARLERPRWDSGENELISCLFDQNDRCTIFDSEAIPDFEEPMAPVELQLDPSYEDFRLSPRSMMIPSDPPALVQIDAAHAALEPSSSPSIASCRRQEIPEFPQYGQNECNNEMLSLFDTDRWVVDKSRHDLPPSSSQGPTESPALVQMNVMPTLTTETETSQVVPPPVTPPSLSNADSASSANPPRNRPFKNVRERRRRANMKNKFMQLYNLCCSKAVAPLTSNSAVEATGLLIPISGGGGAPLALVNQEPSKVEILGDAIKAFEALDKELSDLRTRNRELRMANLTLG